MPKLDLEAQLVLLGRESLEEAVNLPGASEGKLFNFISRACPPRFVQGRFQGKS